MSSPMRWLGLWPIVLLPDIQSRLDNRDLRIDAVGIKGVRYPITIRAGKRLLPTIATLSMTVALPAVAKGTHMSRFIELLEARTEALDQQRFKTMLLDMLDRLEAYSGAIEMRFPYFVRKTAPVSGVQSQLDYEVCWRGSVSDAGHYSFRMHVTVPATSLCPCSKEISAYGAHNQRSHIGIDIELVGEMAIEELIAIAERSAFCEVYGLLKRQDEKYVTERAYDNPKFVEDLVRDVALALNQEPRVVLTQSKRRTSNRSTTTPLSRISRGKKRRQLHAAGQEKEGWVEYQSLRPLAQHAC